MARTKYNPLGTMTPEQFAEFCKARGVEPGQWRQMGNKPFEPSFVGAQKELLTKLRDSLGQAVEADRREVLRLKQQLQRLKHGGGS